MGVPLAKRHRVLCGISRLAAAEQSGPNDPRPVLLAVRRAHRFSSRPSLATNPVELVKLQSRDF